MVKANNTRTNRNIMNIMVMVIMEDGSSVPDVTIVDTNKLSDPKTQNILQSAKKEIDGTNAEYVVGDDDFSDGSAEVMPPCMVDKILTIWLE